MSATDDMDRRALRIVGRDPASPRPSEAADSDRRDRITSAVEGARDDDGASLDDAIMAGIAAAGGTPSAEVIGWARLAYRGNYRHLPERWNEYHDDLSQRLGFDVDRVIKRGRGDGATWALAVGEASGEPREVQLGTISEVRRWSRAMDRLAEHLCRVPKIKKPWWDACVSLILGLAEDVDLPGEEGETRMLLAEYLATSLDYRSYTRAGQVRQLTENPWPARISAHDWVFRLEQLAQWLRMRTERLTIRELSVRLDRIGVRQYRHAATEQRQTIRTGRLWIVDHACARALELPGYLPQLTAAERWREELSLDEAAEAADTTDTTAGLPRRTTP